MFNVPLQRQFAKDNQKQYSYRKFMPNHLHICKKISTFAQFFSKSALHVSKVHQTTLIKN